MSTATAEKSRTQRLHPPTLRAVRADPHRELRDQEPHRDGADEHGLLVDNLGYVNEQIMAYYAARANGGIGLIITECVLGTRLAARGSRTRPTCTCSTARTCPASRTSSRPSTRSAPRSSSSCRSASAARATATTTSRRPRPRRFRTRPIPRCSRPKMRKSIEKNIHLLLTRRSRRMAHRPDAARDDAGRDPAARSRSSVGRACLQ